MQHFPFAYPNPIKTNSTNPILSISNLTHYYSFNNFTPAIGAVDSWNNSITANQAFTQTVNNQKGTNNGGFLNLDGIDDFYTAHSSFTSIIASANMSLFVVASTNSPATGDQRVYTQQNAGGGSRLNFRLNFQARFGTVYNNTSNNGVDIISNQVALVQANKFNILGRIDQAPNLTFYQNSSIVGIASDLASFTAGTGNLGSFSNTQFFWGGNIAEIYLFNRALTVQEVNIVNSYLTLKWL
jgi:hypothetical protein